MFVLSLRSSQVYSELKNRRDEWKRRDKSKRDYRRKRRISTLSRSRSSDLGIIDISEMYEDAWNLRQHTLMSTVWTVYRQLDASLEAPLSSRPNRRGGEKSWTRNARCLVSIVGYGKRSFTEHDSDATLCQVTRLAQVITLALTLHGSTSSYVLMVNF